MCGVAEDSACRGATCNHIYPGDCAGVGGEVHCTELEVFDGGFVGGCVVVEATLSYVDGTVGEDVEEYCFGG